jgi:drug/metabolite transporter (DMT)-like permease
MFSSRNNASIIASLLFAVFLWGGNNAGVKFLVRSWPPIWVGSTRFLCAGLVLFAILRWTKWMGPATSAEPGLKKQLWLRGGLSLAVYIVAFNWSLQYTSASHVALYLGAAPVWALMWEGWKHQDKRLLARRYAAAALAFSGVLLLLWPTLKTSSGTLPGEVLGLAASVLWTLYGRQCRSLASHFSGAEITAHTIFSAGLLLLPLAAVEVTLRQAIVWHTNLVLVQLYCIVAGGVVAFALWNNALRHWKTSQVYIFNNLIPLSMIGWAHFCLGEEVTPTFWLAMGLILSGVLISNTTLQKLLDERWMPAE